MPSLLLFDGVTADKLQTELRGFEELWPTLKQLKADAYGMQEKSQNSDSESEQDMKTLSSTNKSCKASPLCYYKVFLKLILFTDAYRGVALAYKFLLRLPVSQVSRERPFSAFEDIKKPSANYNDTSTS